ncbi:armadillo repeat-containing protein 2 [Planococcus citri]|uniref:armadillo repeat-containing protein 2 n=1 Tax=Planococcus citri TaxID=170843 RepID=UPI0031F9D57A
MEFSKYTEKRAHNQQILRLKTSAEIINEAKAAISLNSIMNTKIVKTNRPFTPKDSQRILFEQRKKERPSSSVSFQNVKFQEIDLFNKHEKSNKISPRNAKTKLPTLVNHKSMISLEKLPEEFLEIIPEQREIYSSPAPGTKSKFGNKTDQVWFPHVTSTSAKSTNRIIPNSLDRAPIKFKLTNAWIDDEKTIQENKINEARAVLQLQSKDTVQSILSAMNKNMKKYKDEEMIMQLKKLYDCLEREHISQNQDSSLTKNLILKTVFSLIDSPNEILLLQIAKIILFLQVTGVNLATVCKLVFKISRSDKNDELFLEKNIIGPFVNCLGLATPDEDSEALIYGYGALKFLMMNSNILYHALENGILPLMTLHLKMINLAKTEGSNFPEQTSHVLFQLTGCLRNVANDETTYEKFVTSGTLSALCKTTKLFISDIDLVVNVARIMSILSTNDECCGIIADDEYSLHSLLRICKMYTNREDIIVRITYALGNVLATCDHARIKLYSSVENSLDTILHLLKYYLETDLKLSLEKNFNKSQVMSTEDVFIKVIRVIANMCIDEQVGISLVSLEETHEKIKEFLDCLLIILRRKTIHENEELIISALSTLNNLSYYSFPEFKGPFHDRSLDISEVLNSLLAVRHEECVLEVGRVYSNLSRSSVVRKYLLETGGLNYVVDWLDSSNKDLLLVTTGVLINMMVEKEARQFLKYTNGIEKLIKNLNVYAEEDWHLGNLICQVIWNFTIEDDDLFTELGYQHAQNLLNVLIDLLDEDKFFAHYSDALKSMEYKQWEDFSVVATNILEKMEARNSSE